MYMYDIKIYASAENQLLDLIKITSKKYILLNL